MKRQGFTLIELLVVIAIIAILAAILFPVFALAKESGKRATCQSSMKQMTVATLMYMNDNGDVFPPCSWTPTDDEDPNHTAKDTWADRIYPYAKNRKIARCPNFVRQIAMSNKKITVYEPLRWWTGYGYNIVDLCDYRGDVKNPRDPSVGTWCGHSMGSIRHPSQVALYGENAFSKTDGVRNYGVWRGSPKVPGDTGNIEARHSGTAVFSCVDGSVKSMTISKAMDALFWKSSERTP